METIMPKREDLLERLQDTILWRDQRGRLEQEKGKRGF